MSSFTTELIVSPLGNGRNWVLKDKFRYHIGSEFSRHYIDVPKRFVTDFASIPRWLWFLPEWAKYSKAPVLHDWLYYGKYYTRKESDDIFLEAMMVDWRNHKSRYFMASLEYLVVRLFGWLAWNKSNLSFALAKIKLDDIAKLRKENSNC